MFEKFSDDARAAVVSAQNEARALTDHHIGTEHVLLALLDQRGSTAQRVLSRFGVTHESVMADVHTIRRPRRDTAAEDREALKTIGIDLDAVRAAVEEAFGPGALSRPPDEEAPGRRAGWRRRRQTGPRQAPRGHIPFSPRAKKVLEVSLREAQQLKHGHIGTEHLLLAIVDDKQGAAARLLVDAGTDLAQVREAVLAETAGAS